MLYQRPSFTVPASNTATQKQWDMAFLSADEFKAKYGEDRDKQANEQD